MPPEQFFLDHECANWVHCKRRGSKKSTFLVILMRFWLGIRLHRGPVLPFLVFWNSLFFFSPCEEFLVFSSVFPFFSRDFRGSVGIKNPCFFGGFPCLFPKKQGKEGQGDSLISTKTLILQALLLNLPVKLFDNATKLSLHILFPYRSPSPRPHHDPTQHPETDPKRTRNRPETEPNGAETEPKRSQTEPKWTEIKVFAVGRAGGLSG